MLIAIAAIGVGCGSEAIDPALEVGFVRAGVFEPLAEGDPCTVVQAPQGGYWVMPTLRATGVAPQVTAACTVRDLTIDAELGHAEVAREMLAADDGWQELLFMLHLDTIDTSAKFDELAGRPGELSCTVSDGALSLDYVAPVVLELWTL